VSDASTIAGCKGCRDVAFLTAYYTYSDGSRSTVHENVVSSRADIARLAALALEADN
jgi:hypothetical protein